MLLMSLCLVQNYPTSFGLIHGTISKLFHISRNAAFVIVLCYRFDFDNALQKLGHLLLENAEEATSTLQEMTIFYKDDKQNSLLVLYESENVPKETRYLTNASILTLSGK